jgi:hypothetical protein
MRYEAFHIQLTGPIKTKSLLEAQTSIEKIAGYNPLVEDSFQDYFTASIYSYNCIGRKKASYYFSGIDKKWHKIQITRLSYYSYEKALWPFKFFAQKYLELTGHKAQEDKETSEFIKQRKIEKLYPKN